MPVITRTATLDQLLEKIERLEAIRTMKATVELRLSYENDERTQVRDLRDVPGFILAERPSNIRAIAQVPVVRTLAFQMASNGQMFQMHVPSKKRFFIGSAVGDAPSENRTENIRPQHILEALLIEPQQANELASLENAIEGLTPYQVVTMVRPRGDQKAKIARKFWFIRETLELSHMQILDDHGDTATLARYEQWADQGGLPYAGVVTVIRPTDGYTLRIHIVSPGLNETVPEDSFVLEVPEGVTVERLGEKSAEQANAKAGASSETRGR
jgi:outer membrane lipoprotein-sorting protein